MIVARHLLAALVAIVAIAEPVLASAETVEVKILNRGAKGSMAGFRIAAGHREKDARQG